MTHTTKSLVLTGLATLALVTPAAGQQPCENLRQLALPDVVVRSATPVAAGDFHLPSATPNTPPIHVPAFYRVVGLFRPGYRFPNLISSTGSFYLAPQLAGFRAVQDVYLFWSTPH